MSQQINLYAPALRTERRASTTLLVCAVGIVVAVAVVAGAYEHYQLRRIAGEAEAVSRSLKEAQARYDKLIAERAGRAPDAGREGELLDLMTQVKRRRQVVDAVNSGAIGSSAGFSEVMRALSRQSLTGVWLTGFDIAAGGKELALSGRALDAELVPRYVERLNREAVLQGRQFSSLKIEQPPAPAAASSPTPEGKDAASQKLRTPALRFVEFSMSTSDREGDAQPRPASALQPLPEIPAAAVIARKPSPAEAGKARAEAAKAPAEGAP